jgi:outer membrane protein assembly factor BamB
VKLYASSIARGSNVPRDTGSLACVDLETGETLGRRGTTPLPICRVDANPRGGTRGWRGLVVDGEEVVVCNYDSFVYLSADLTKVRKVVTHPFLANLHGLYRCPLSGSLLAASTRNDAVVDIDPASELTIRHTWDWDGVHKAVRAVHGEYAESPALSTEIDYRDEWQDDVLHLNYVRRLSSGRLVALLGRLDTVVELEPDPHVIHVRPTFDYAEHLARLGTGVDNGPGPSAPHDIVELETDVVLFNSSKTGVLYTLDCVDGTLTEIWRAPDTGRGWQRGLAVSDEGIAYVGTGVGDILQINLKTGEQVGEFTVFPRTSELRQAIFAIQLVA